MSRGEVWLSALDPTVGSEIRKTRPCLVVSPPELNERLRTVIVAPLTTGGWAAPFRIPSTFGERRGYVVLDQLRALDKVRLLRCVGAIERDELANVLDGLRTMFED